MINLSMQTYKSFAPKCILSKHLNGFLHQNGRYRNISLRSSISPIVARTFTSSSQRQVFQKNRYWAYLSAGLFTGVCLQQAYASSKKKIEEGDIKKWMDFNEKLQSNTDGKIPPPFEPVEKLASKYLKEPCTILDIGCETGKNAACLIKNRHKIVLLDIAPNAIEYTIENLKREGLDHGIQDSVVSKIEDLPAKYGPFKAVVGTYAFSFIPPHLFAQTMKENIFNRLDQDGYFVGGFFGEQHAWANNKELTILNIKELESFFTSQGFSILDISEQIKETTTVSNGITKFHTINIIAQKALKSS